MIRNIFRAGLLAVIAAASLLADVSYQQTTRFTGGTLVDMMRKMGGMMSNRMGKAFQDDTSTVYLKGNKMASVGSNSSSIIDLDAGTITSINNADKSYSVMTFEEMHQMMEEAQQKMRGTGAGNMEFDVSVKPTGQSRMIDGQAAQHFTILMTLKGNEAGMKVKVDSWNAASRPGSEEIRKFFETFASKSKVMPGLGAGAMMGGASKGMAAAMKEAYKLEGAPVLTETEVSGVSSPLAMMQQGGGDPNAPFLKTVSEYKNFSTTPIDDSKFVVPAGYKQQKRGR